MKFSNYGLTNIESHQYTFFTLPSLFTSYVKFYTGTHVCAKVYGYCDKENNYVKYKDGL